MERISELEYGSPGTPLNVRILRKWIPHFRSLETWFLAIDKHGDAIQVLAEKGDQRYIEVKFIVSRCYQIEDYTCSDTNEHQKMLKSEIHINVGPASQLDEIDDDASIPKYWFQFCTAEKLITVDVKVEGYPDLIGVFKKLKETNKADGQPYCVLSLIDTDTHEVNIALWKECIDVKEKFDRTKLISSSSDTIVAVTNVKPATVAGETRFSSTAATHVFANPDIPETKLLLQRLHSQTDPLAKTHTPDTVITLQKLCTKQHSEAIGKTYICYANIDSFTFKNSWYNGFCPKCGKLISRKGPDWFCTTDGKTLSPKILYNLSAIINDKTSTIQTTLSNESVENMVRKSCKILVQDEGFEDRKNIPPPLQQCTFTQFCFHIQLSKYATPERPTYAIIDIAPATLTGLHIIPATPPPSLQLADRTETSFTKALKTVPEKSLQTKRQLTYESTDDVSLINPSKRARYAD